MDTMRILHTLFHHVTSDPTKLEHGTECQDMRELVVGNGQEITIKQVGIGSIHCERPRSN